MASKDKQKSTGLPQKLVPAPLEPLKRYDTYGIASGSFIADYIRPNGGPQIIVPAAMNEEFRVLKFPRSFLPDGNPLLQNTIEDKHTGTYTLGFRSEGYGHFFADYLSALSEGRVKFDLQKVSSDDIMELLTLYDFGMQMNDKLYQDYVMDALRFSLCHRQRDGTRMAVPTVQYINDVYGKTQTGSRPRNMMTHLCACASIGTFLRGLEGPESELPNPEFVRHLVTILDTCIQQSYSYKALRQTFREGYPWPYFHTIGGTTEELTPEETVMESTETES